VEHPDDKLRVEPWKTTVRDVLASRSPQSSTDTDFVNAEAIIDTINRHVKLRTGKNAQWLNPIFRAFENDPVCVTFRLPVHCEAVLASLVTYAPESQTESVKTFIQNIRLGGSIAMSTQCCPVCWEFLHILKGCGAEFHVRGCHTTIHPVELPQWLPHEVVEELVIQFQKILLHKVMVMMKRQWQAEYDFSLSMQGDSDAASHNTSFGLPTLTLGRLRQP